MDTASTNPRMNISKTPIWSQATVQNFKTSKVIVVSLSYERNFSILSGLDNGRLFKNDMAKLVMYQDSTHQYHEEVITSFPDSNYQRSGNSDFSGILKVKLGNGYCCRNINILAKQFCKY